MTKQIQIKIYELPQGMANKLVRLDLPNAFLEEIVSFVQRNTFLKIIKDNTPIENVFCHSCLKSHIRKISREFSLNKKLAKKALSSVKGEEGHNGYYLDKEELISIY